MTAMVKDFLWISSRLDAYDISAFLSSPKGSIILKKREKENEKTFKLHHHLTLHLSPTKPHPITLLGPKQSYTRLHGHPHSWHSAFSIPTVHSIWLCPPAYFSHREISLLHTIHSLATKAPKWVRNVVPHRIANTVPLEGIHTSGLNPHFVVLQLE